MNKLKICVVTASRSEYGTLRWLIDEIVKDNDLCLQLIVTGSHLSFEQGCTYLEIEKDGYQISEKIEMLMSSSSLVGIVKSMGICSLSIGEVFSRLMPNIVVVLGDRYELLPICSAALIMNISIAHISGGDITKGAIDDQIRNAITMMASIHFPGVKDSAHRLERMIGSNKNIYPVGEPGLDNFTRLNLLPREELANNLNLDVNKQWILLTYHPETRISLEKNIAILKNIVSDILDAGENFQLIVTKANADYGGVQINEYLTQQSQKRGFILFDSLGQLRYMSLMRNVYCIIGNSSSGIIEAPFLGKSVINIGNRQEGRYFCENIINVSGEKGTVGKALNQLKQTDHSYKPDNYYGDGLTSVKIKEYIKAFLLTKDK